MTIVPTDQTELADKARAYMDEHYASMKDRDEDQWMSRLGMLYDFVTKLADGELGEPPCSAWLPLESAPRDKPILAAWGTAERGAMGWDIMKHKGDDEWESENSGYILPADGFVIIGWMNLPGLPENKGKETP